MASARLKPRTNIAHVREGTIRRSRAIHAVHRRGGLHQHTNDSAERRQASRVWHGVARFGRRGSRSDQGLYGVGALATPLPKFLLSSRASRVRVPAWW
jgi:hypothetical protein